MKNWPFLFFQHKSLSVSAFERNKSVMFACVCNVWVSCPGHVGFVVSGLTWLHSKYLGLPFANFGARCPLKFHSRIDRTLFESVFGICYRDLLDLLFWRANDYWPVIQYVQRCIQTVSGSTGVYVKNYPSDLGTRSCLKLSMFLGIGFLSSSDCMYTFMSLFAK